MEETTEKPLVGRVLAELAGSFLLCFAIYIANTSGVALFGLNMVFAAVSTGLIYTVVTALFAKISGGQLNPAITVAAMLTSKTKIVDGVLYIVAQLVGAILAGLLAVNLLPTSDTVTMKTWLNPAVNGYGENSVTYSALQSTGLSFSVVLAIAVELIAGLIIVGTAIANMGEHGEVSDRYVAFTGLAYALGAAITYAITGAALNPARSTGIAIFSHGKGLNVEPLTQLWVFWLCPILAAALIALGFIVVELIAAKKSTNASAAVDNAADEVEHTVETVEDKAAETADKVADTVKKDAAAVKAEAKAVETKVADKAEQVKDAAEDKAAEAVEGGENFANDAINYLNDKVNNE